MMKPFSSLVAFSLLAFLCACGTDQIASWNKPDTTEDQKAKDMQECDYEASKATTGSMQPPKSTDEAVSDGVVRGMEKSDLIKKCMRIRGYE